MTCNQQPSQPPKKSSFPPPPSLWLSLITTVTCSPRHLLLQGRQTHAILLFALEWHTELEELHDHGTELLEEDPVVLGVAFDVLAEFLVLDERHVCGQHHQGFGALVFVLFGAVPLGIVSIFLPKLVHDYREKRLLKWVVRDRDAYLLPAPFLVH